MLLLIRSAQNSSDFFFASICREEGNFYFLISLYEIKHKCREKSFSRNYDETISRNKENSFKGEISRYQKFDLK